MTEAVAWDSHGDGEVAVMVMEEEEVVAHCSVSGVILDDDGDDGRGGEVVEVEVVMGLQGYMGVAETVGEEHKGEVVKVVEESSRDSSWWLQGVFFW